MIVEVRGRASVLAEAQRGSKLQGIPFNADETLPQLVVMAQGESGPLEGKFFAWLQGDQYVKDFCHYGYRRIRLRCPILRRRCIAEKCQWYRIQNGIGDCVVTFAADR